MRQFVGDLLASQGLEDPEPVIVYGKICPLQTCVSIHSVLYY